MIVRVVWRCSLCGREADGTTRPVEPLGNEQARRYALDVLDRAESERREPDQSEPLDLEALSVRLGHTDLRLDDIAQALVAKVRRLQEERGDMLSRARTREAELAVLREELAAVTQNRQAIYEALRAAHLELAETRPIVEAVAKVTARSSPVGTWLWRVDVGRSIVLAAREWRASHPPETGDGD